MLFVTVLTSWRYLGSVWATCGRPLAPQGGPWELQGPFLMNFGGPSGSLGAPFVHQDRVLDPCFSMSGFAMVHGRFLMDFGCSWHALGPEKLCKTIGGLFKIKVRRNSV